MLNQKVFSYCYNIFGTIYRADKSEMYWDLLDISIANAVDMEMDTIILGDFNLDLLSDNKTKLCYLEAAYGLNQLISEPTRITHQSRTLIDWILVTCPNKVRGAGVLDPICSDHCPVYVTIASDIQREKCYKRKIYDYSRANIANLKRDIEMIGNRLNLTEDIDILTSRLTDELLNSCDANIPHRSVLIRPKDPLWMNNEIRHLIRKRNRQHKIAKISNRPSDWQLFRVLRNKVISSVRKAKKQHINRIDTAINESTGSKTWWKLVKSYLLKKSAKKNCHSIIKADVLYEDLTDVTELMNAYFTNQSTVLDPDDDPPPLDERCDDRLTDIILGTGEVKDILLSVDTSKATGPDKIGNKIIKTCADSLAPILGKIFNLSLKMSTFPNIWKEAYVIPIYKTGNLYDCSNYRPVALISCIAKIFEKCIFKYVFNFLRDNNLLTNLQSGFTPGDSTTNQLTFLYDFIAKALDDGKEVRAVFCDISKAFDKVWHKGILHKLKSYGIHGNLLKWFESYLNNRTQRVVINGQTSSSRTVSAGVPQGSVLGPLLFMIYINDIVENIDSNIRLFADDTSLYVIVDDPVVTADCLNNDLLRISTWAKKWKVSFNPNKTKSIQFSRKRNKSIKPELSMSGVKVQEVENHKHLGLIFQSNCQWDIHINSIIKKASPLINCLRSIKYRLSRKSLEIIYKSFILPIFDYCGHIWDNCTQEQSNLLEKLNLDALRSICGAVRGTSHNLIYEETNFLPLKERRHISKLTTFYKMKNEEMPEYLCKLLPPPTSAYDYNLRANSSVRTVKCRTSSYARSFLPNTINLWNSLTTEIQNSDTLSNFKKSLRRSPNNIVFDLNYGSRACQVIHSRLRLGCSDLNADKFNRHIADSPSCSCGHPIENAVHFFFTCNYTRLRQNSFFYSQGFNINMILRGSTSLNKNDLHILLKSIHEYIIKSDRFTL